MLICNVSLRPPRLAIAAAVAEIVAATDATATGNIAFATLVDDSTSVRDSVDAYFGQIMLETASAAAVVNAGLVLGDMIVEQATAAASYMASGGGIAAAVSEPTTGLSAQDATLIATKTALVTDRRAPVFVTPTLATVAVLGSGTLLTVQ